MDLVTRDEWGARPPEDGATEPYDPVGVALHWAGGGWPWPWDHSTCDDKLRAIQDDYMDGRNYSDIGYNYGTCPHRSVYELRGDRRNAANGGDGNANGTHCAILGLWGTRSGPPVPGLLHGYRDAIDYVRTRGVGPEITGHRDHTATECPGDDIYAWLRAGAIRPEEEEDMAVSDEDVRRIATAVHDRKVQYGNDLLELDLAVGRTARTVANLNPIIRELASRVGVPIEAEELAAALAPLLIDHLPGVLLQLSDEQAQRFAAAVNDDLARRVAS